MALTQSHIWQRLTIRAQGLTNKQVNSPIGARRIPYDGRRIVKLFRVSRRRGNRMIKS